MVLPVLIIGTGLSGLTLAHSLQKHSIPYLLFERDGASSQRAQGYRINLDGGDGTGGGDGLRAALSEELFEEFEESCGEAHRPGGRVDGRSGRVLQKGVLGLIGTGGWPLVWGLGSRFVGKRWERSTWVSWRAWLWSWIITPPSAKLPTLPTGPSESYPTDRRVLRSILLTSQLSHISYSSSFTHYTLSPSSITAHLSNGSTIEGSLLVGADGVHSLVAAQLLGPAATPQSLGFRVVYGKTPLTSSVEGTLLPILKKGPSFVTDTTGEGHRITLVVEAMRFDHPRAPPNYVFWALCAVTEVFLDPETNELLDLDQVLHRLTDHWDPRILTLFDNRSPFETASLALTSSNPDHTSIWETDARVTLLGDAVHCMPPTGGQGGNSAMWDAAVLGNVLGESGEDGEEGWSKETILRYEDAMRRNIGDVVGMACVGVEKAFR